MKLIRLMKSIKILFVLSWLIIITSYSLTSQAIGNGEDKGKGKEKEAYTAQNTPLSSNSTAAAESSISDDYTAEIIGLYTVAIDDLRLNNDPVDSTCVFQFEEEIRKNIHRRGREIYYFEKYYKDVAGQEGERHTILKKLLDKCCDNKSQQGSAKNEICEFLTGRSRYILKILYNKRRDNTYQHVWDLIYYHERLNDLKKLLPGFALGLKLVNKIKNIKPSVINYLIRLIDDILVPERRMNVGSYRCNSELYATLSDADIEILNQIILLRNTVYNEANRLLELPRDLQSYHNVPSNLEPPTDNEASSSYFNSWWPHCSIL